MRRLKRVPLKVGDLVLIHNTRIKQEMNRKHKPRYLGPYILRELRSSGTWAISELDGTPSRTAVAGFRIWPYIARNPRILQELAEKGDSKEESDDEEEEEAEEEEDQQDTWDSDEDMMEVDEEHKVDDEPWGLMITEQDKKEESEDAILLLNSQFFEELVNQRKSAEY